VESTWLITVLRDKADDSVSTEANKKLGKKIVGGLQLGGVVYIVGRGTDYEGSDCARNLVHLGWGIPLGVRVDSAVGPAASVRDQKKVLPNPAEKSGSKPFWLPSERSTGRR